MVDLSVCIVSWNSLEDLRTCLRSIYGQVWAVSHEVIVVDNASTDGSADMVRAEFPQARVIALQENGGFALANNRAFALAAGRYMLMLNPDTLVEPHALERLVSFADRRADAGVVGPKLLNVDRSVQRSAWRGFPSLRIALSDAFYLWRVSPDIGWVREIEVKEEAHGCAIPVDHVLGAAMLVRTEVYRRIGGMDEAFFLFFEETDWCFRIQQSGWRVYYYPGAQIVHVGQRSVHQAPVRTLPEYYRNFVRLYRRRHGHSAMRVGLLKGIIAAAQIVRIGLWTWRGRAAETRGRARCMRAGYAQVLRELGSF